MSLTAGLSAIASIAGETAGIVRAYTSAPASISEWPSVVAVIGRGLVALGSADGDDWMYTHSPRLWLIVAPVEKHISNWQQVGELIMPVIASVNGAWIANDPRLRAYSRVMVTSYDANRLIEYAGSSFYGAELILDIKEHTQYG